MVNITETDLVVKAKEFFKVSELGELKNKTIFIRGEDFEVVATVVAVAKFACHKTVNPPLSDGFLKFLVSMKKVFIGISVELVTSHQVAYEGHMQTSYKSFSVMFSFNENGLEVKTNHFKDKNIQVTFS
jgi:hypothetical protein